LIESPQMCKEKPELERLRVELEEALAKLDDEEGSDERLDAARSSCNSGLAVIQLLDRIKDRKDVAANHVEIERQKQVPQGLEYKETHDLHQSKKEIQSWRRHAQEGTMARVKNPDKPQGPAWGTVESLCKHMDKLVTMVERLAEENEGYRRMHPKNESVFPKPFLGYLQRGGAIRNTLSLFRSFLVAPHQSYLKYLGRTNRKNAIKFRQSLTHDAIDILVVTVVGVAVGLLFHPMNSVVALILELLAIILIGLSVYVQIPLGMKSWSGEGKPDKLESRFLRLVYLPGIFLLVTTVVGQS